MPRSLALSTVFLHINSIDHCTAVHVFAQNYDDQMHLYTLTIWPTNTYEVKYDDAVVASGDLAADFNFPQNDPDIYKLEAGSIEFLMTQVCSDLCAKHQFNVRNHDLSLNTLVRHADHTYLLV